LKGSHEQLNRLTMSGKCLVVYYSKTGNTKIIAEAISKRMGGDLCEVSEQGTARSSFDPSGYDLVVVGTPVNGFSTSLPIQIYLKENRLKLPNVAFFATYGLYTAGTFGGMSKLAGKKPLTTVAIKGTDANQGKIDAKVDGFVAALKK
jgi:flavodoxin